MIWVVVIAACGLVCVSALAAAWLGAATGGAHASDDRPAPPVPPVVLPLAERARRAHLEHVDRVHAAEELLDRAFGPATTIPKGER